MEIKVLCSKEEFKRIDEIQEALNPVMKSLSEMGLKGSMEIIEAEGDR